MTIEKLKELDKFELQCSRELENLLARLNPEEMPVSTLHAILLQRYWISEEFTHIYDVSLNRMTDASSEAQEIVRRIIRDEYPIDPNKNWKTPSHREDLVTDLLRLGISRKEFVSSTPSPTTSIVIESAKQIVRSFGSLDSPDIPLLAFLRFWGEVTTAVEYGCFFPRLKKLFGRHRSAFYNFHTNQDAKRFSLLETISSYTLLTTHSDQLGFFIADSVSRDNSKNQIVFTQAKEATRTALTNKIDFYRQFL
jgi:hypothetical protein